MAQKKSPICTWFPTLWVMRNYEPLKPQGYGLAEISISSRLQDADIIYCFDKFLSRLAWCPKILKHKSFPSYLIGVFCNLYCLHVPPLLWIATQSTTNNNILLSDWKVLLKTERLVYVLLWQCVQSISTLNYDDHGNVAILQITNKKRVDLATTLAHSSVWE